MREKQRHPDVPDAFAAVLAAVLILIAVLVVGIVLISILILVAVLVLVLIVIHNKSSIHFLCGKPQR